MLDGANGGRSQHFALIDNIIAVFKAKGQSNTFIVSQLELLRRRDSPSVIINRVSDQIRCFVSVLPQLLSCNYAIATIVGDIKADSSGRLKA